MNPHIKQVLVALVLIIIFTVVSHLPFIGIVLLSFLLSVLGVVNIDFTPTQFKADIEKYFNKIKSYFKK